MSHCDQSLQNDFEILNSKTDFDFDSASETYIRLQQTGPDKIKAFKSITVEPSQETASPHNTYLN